MKTKLTRIDKTRIYIRRRDKTRCVVVKTGKRVAYVTFPLLYQFETDKDVFLRTFRLPNAGELSVQEALDIEERRHAWGTEPEAFTRQASHVKK